MTAPMMQAMTRPKILAMTAASQTQTMLRKMQLDFRNFKSNERRKLMFTQIERRYLMAEHSGMAVINQETMQIPPRILNAILARRAQMLGRAFVEFRNENRTDAASQIGRAH